MYWPITHLVAPAEDAVGGAGCRAEEGRLAGLAGICLPGGEPNARVGLVGKLMVRAALPGVAGHGALRRVAGRKGGSDV